MLRTSQYECVWYLNDRMHSRFKLCVDSDPADLSTLDTTTEDSYQGQATTTAVSLTDVPDQTENSTPITATHSDDINTDVYASTTMKPKLYDDPADNHTTLSIKTSTEGI